MMMNSRDESRPVPSSEPQKLESPFLLLRRPSNSFQTIKANDDDNNNKKENKMSLGYDSILSNDTTQPNKSDDLEAPKGEIMMQMVEALQEAPLDVTNDPFQQRPHYERDYSSRSSHKDYDDKIEMRTKRRRNWFIIMTFIFLVVVVVTVVPSVVFTRKQNQDNSNSNNGSSAAPHANVADGQQLGPEDEPVPSASPTISATTRTETTSFPTLSPSLVVTSTEPTPFLLDALTEILLALKILPQEYVADEDNFMSRAISWMAFEDQITPLLLREQQEKQIIQRFALVSFYYATRGDEWTDSLGFLNSTRHECDWQAFGRDQLLLGGASIDCINETIVGIALNDNGLDGSIPETIELLSDLTWLELRNNFIQNGIPTSISKLRHLEAVMLGNNSLSGEIPPELTTLENLRFLTLPWNDLSGPIPESIEGLSSLKFLNLLSNILSGSIPSTIANLSNLQQLNLAFNILSADLPSFSGDNVLPVLEGYFVGWNELTGSLPFAASSFPALEIFSGFRNYLTGDISTLGHFPNLARLEISQNRLSGVISTEFCKLPITFMDASSNMLSGALPGCLANISTLETLILSQNEIEGTIPKLPTSIEFFNLDDNSLTGGIPEGPFPNLKRLSLSFNNFTGVTIPTEIGEATNLKSLSLIDCHLSGTIPSQIGLLSQLSLLGLSSNSLTGIIPTDIGLLTNLKSLLLSFNLLRGTIPEDIGNLSKLKTVTLNDNNLSGRLPSNLPLTLNVLTLQNTNLTGSAEPVCTTGRSFRIFNADCENLLNCSCCTSCCETQPSCSG